MICIKFSAKANEQMIKFWWRSGSLPGYRDCFTDSSLLGDTVSAINGHRSAAHTDSPDNGTRRRALAEVCTVPVLLVLYVMGGFS